MDENLWFEYRKIMYIYWSSPKVLNTLSRSEYAWLLQTWVRTAHLSRTAHKEWCVFILHVQCFLKISFWNSGCTCLEKKHENNFVHNLWGLPSFTKLWPHRFSRTEAFFLKVAMLLVNKHNWHSAIRHSSFKVW